MKFLLTAAWLVAMITTGAMADDFEYYADFRYMSGLPGGGYGVSQDGQVGFNGALQMNIPVGYTPGAGQYALMASTSATNGGIPTSINDEDANSTLALGFGTTIQGHALWIADMVVDSGWDDAINLQFQLLPERENRPAVSVGVTDLTNDFYSLYSQSNIHDSRSFFVAATRQFSAGTHPFWGTVGFGNRRFNDRPFAGLSYQANPRVKVMAEYDGWNVNAGAAYDIQGGWGEGRWHSVFLLGLTDLDRVTLSLGFTYSGSPLDRE